MPRKPVFTKNNLTIGFSVQNLVLWIICRLGNWATLKLFSKFFFDSRGEAMNLHAVITIKLPYEFAKKLQKSLFANPNTQLEK